MRLLHGGAKYKITGAEVVPRILTTFATHYSDVITVFLVVELLLKEKDEKSTVMMMRQVLQSLLEGLEVVEK